MNLFLKQYWTLSKAPLVLLVIAITFFIGGCKDEEAAGPPKITKRMNIELPADMSTKVSVKSKGVVSPKSPTAPTAATVAASTVIDPVKPEIGWIKPKSTTKKKPTVKRSSKKSKTASKKTASKSKTATLTKSKTGSAKAALSSVYAVSVASFSAKSKADALKKKLNKSGYSAYIADFTLKGKKWYRVRVGFYKSEDDAYVAKTKIEKKYNTKGAWVVKPTRAERSAHSG